MLTVGGPRRVRHASVKKYKKTSRLFFRKIDTLPWETGEFTAPPPARRRRAWRGVGGGLRVFGLAFPSAACLEPDGSRAVETGGKITEDFTSLGDGALRYFYE